MKSATALLAALFAACQLHANPPTFYLAGADSSREKAGELGVPVMVMVYQPAFDPEMDGVIDWDLLVQAIVERVPEDYEGIVHFSYEHPRVVSDLNSNHIPVDDFTWKLDEAHKIADAMDMHRPGVRWGLWGFLGVSKWTNKAIEDTPGIDDWSKLSPEAYEQHVDKWRDPRVVALMERIPVSMPYAYDSYDDDASDVKAWQITVTDAWLAATMAINLELLPNHEIVPHYNFRHNANQFGRRIDNDEAWRNILYCLDAGLKPAIWGLDSAATPEREGGWNGYYFQPDEVKRRAFREQCQAELEAAGIVVDLDTRWPENEQDIRDYFVDDAANFLAWLDDRILDYTQEDCNAPPSADAVVEQLTNIGEDAEIRLDASGSSDAEDSLSELAFEWFVDELPVGTDRTLVVSLGFGGHDVRLRVTDTGGLVSEVIKPVTIDPAWLTVFDVEKVDIHFRTSHPRLRLHGEIGLPMSVDFGESAPFAVVSLLVAGSEIAAVPVIFDVHGHKWKFEDPEAEVGIDKMDIDWKGARFKFEDHDHGIELKSEVMTSSETELTFKYKVDKAGGPFVMDFGGLASVAVDSDGVATATGALLEVERPGREALLTLPFALLETTAITFGGSVVQTVHASDHYTNSIGRFRLEFRFDGASFPLEELTTPRTVEAAVLIGESLYPGQVSFGPDDLEVKNGGKWKRAN